MIVLGRVSSLAKRHDSGQRSSAKPCVTLVQIILHIDIGFGRLRYNDQVDTRRVIREPRSGALPGELTGRPGVKSSTIGRWLAANRYAHRLIGLRTPTRPRTTFLASGIWGLGGIGPAPHINKTSNRAAMRKMGARTLPNLVRLADAVRLRRAPECGQLYYSAVDMSRLGESRLASDTDEHALSSVGLYCLGVKVGHSIAAGPQKRLGGIKDALGRRLRSRLNNNVCLNATANVT